MALLYMMPEAVLYWLPHYMDYLRHYAPDDSFHFESFSSRLSDEMEFVAPIRMLAKPEERGLILAYIDWWESTLTPVELEITGRNIPKIRELWS